MDNKSSLVTTFLKGLRRVASNVGRTVSKTFDKVVYSRKLCLLVSGICAVSICIYFYSSEISLQFISKDVTELNLPSVPVEVLVDEYNFEVSGVPSTVDVTVSGAAGDIALVRTQNSVTVDADLRNLEEGTSTVTLKAQGVPIGLDTSLNPATAEVTLSRKVSRSFFISPELMVGAGQNSSDFTTPSLSVKSVSVRATREKLNSIRSIKAIVDTSGHSGSFSVTCPLVAYDSTGKQVSVSISPDEVEAKVTQKKTTND